MASFFNLTASFVKVQIIHVFARIICMLTSIYIHYIHL